jgi:6-phospho-3-hexuloisomerase
MNTNKVLEFHDIKESVLSEVKTTLDSLNATSVDALMNQILDAEQVFFIGVGHVMLSLQATAKRLAHLGIKTYVVGQITEPAITDKDLLIVGSGSGESAFPLIIAKKAKEIGAKIAHIGSNPHSTMKQYTDVFVRIPVSTKLNLENEIPSVQPMTSLFEQNLLLLGDIISLMIINKNDIDIHNLWKYHANLE